MLKFNIFANILSGGISTLVSIFAIPIYIKYVGLGQYGLIGVLASIQVWFGIYDMVTAPLMGRELSKYTSKSKSLRSIKNLLFSISIVTFLFSGLAGVVIFLLSDWLAKNWLHTGDVGYENSKIALQLIGIVISTRIVESFYRNIIFGLQKQVIGSVINILSALLKFILTVVSLEFIDDSFKSIFTIQILISVVAIAAMFLLIENKYLISNYKNVFNFSELRGIGRYAGRMLSISIATLALAGVDKLLLPSLMSLPDFGVYIVAFTAASALWICVIPVVNAVYPRLCELLINDDLIGASRIYHIAAQAVTVMSASIAFLIICNSEFILNLWLRDSSLANQASQILNVLIFGNLLNAFMYVPYHMQLAKGNLRIIFRVTLASIIVTIPMMLLVVPKYGAIGAAWIYVGLSIANIAIVMGLFYEQALKGDRIMWYLKDIFLPLVPILVISSVQMSIRYNDNNYYRIEILLATMLLMVASALFFSIDLRKSCIMYLKLNEN